MLDLTVSLLGLNDLCCVSLACVQTQSTLCWVLLISVFDLLFCVGSQWSLCWVPRVCEVLNLQEAEQESLWQDAFL